MQLIFNLTNCVTHFKAFDNYKRTELTFRARPKASTITTWQDVVITEHTDINEDGTQIEIVFLAEDFENKSHGFFAQEGSWGVSIGLSCSQQQMLELNNFVVRGIYPKEVTIEIKNIVLNHKNFKMEDDQYQVSSWQIQI
jgi:hypothetical protein